MLIGRAPRASVAIGGAKAAPRLLMPCLLHSNSAGYWLGSRGRHASVAEHARAQGVEHGAYSWPRDPTAFALLGNSMARCILQRLLHGILCSWEILDGPDPWLRGEAQSRLRAEAAGHAPPEARSLPPWPPGLRPPGVACSGPSPLRPEAVPRERQAWDRAAPPLPWPRLVSLKTQRRAVRQQTQLHWQRVRPLVARRTLTWAAQQSQAQMLWQRRLHHPTIPSGRVKNLTAEAPTGSALHHLRPRIPPRRRTTSTPPAAGRLATTFDASPTTAT